MIILLLPFVLLYVKCCLMYCVLYCFMQSKYAGAGHLEVMRSRPWSPYIYKSNTLGNTFGNSFNTEKN